jgi:hypothetical protein
MKLQRADEPFPDRRLKASCLYVTGFSPRIVSARPRIARMI